MGISRSTAYTIANNPVEFIGIGPNDEGKWQGVITHSKEHPRHPCLWLLSSDFRYDSEEEAAEAMKTTVGEIKQQVAADMKTSAAS